MLKLRLSISFANWFQSVSILTESQRFGHTIAENAQKDDFNTIDWKFDE